MTSLEDVRADSITPAQLGSLIGRVETQRLEFKETLDRVDAYELAKDLASFANAVAEPGYIVVGAIQDKKTEKCTGFRSVENVPGTIKKIRDVGAKHIEAPLALEPILRKALTGESLVLVEIPASRKLRAVVTKGKAEYWRRIGTDKREMGPAEIEAAILAGRTGDDQEAARQQRLAGDRTRWSEIADRRVLWEVLDREFRATVRDQRYLRVAVTPHELKDDRFDIGDQNLRTFLWHPQHGQRENGWNVRTGVWGAQILSDPLGLKSEPLEKNGLKLPFIRLTRSGHLEFWAPVTVKTFLPPIYWTSNLGEGFPLWPTAVCEYPVSLFRFAKELYRKADLSCDLTCRMEYSNLRGCILYPFIPGRPGVIFQRPSTYDQQHFEPREITLTGDWDPDTKAFELIKKFYQAFGFSASQIPLFSNGKFEPDRWQC
jgi:schlafen family protein